ncbi:hypothetical protein DCAR_0622949 [Daucus carota subsp. sativus]|uniref:Uncharacterized protein n=1 Tax=Daucus carota subsp. sativus TaxID=79200 RepID=A0AAF0X989_DAUCS|nr:hypothetical protein DCAR_0622949 [Daucus carota subsp. sativus]
MGAGPKVRIKAVVYSLSPLQQDTLPGMFRDMLGKPWIKTYGHWNSLLYYKEKEKMAHRY